MKNFIFHPFEKKSMYILSMLVLLTAQILLLWIFYSLAIQPSNASAVDIDPTEKIATAGANLTFHIKVKSRQEHKVHVHRQLVCDNGSIIILAPDETDVPKGSFDFYQTITIPERTDKGICSLHIEALSRVNILRTDTNNIVSGEFQVVKP